ncbi:MAG: phosphoenolpyruvate--protein phosphotransferase [Moorea sp. SIO2B7]|nr:phosphoenolpyruvate--protein phosphotransferase [Moorena sp. SIO2B7]
MVGIVIVSHSAKLAAAVEELARQMVQKPVAIATAAGIDDPENPFGTDVIAIQTAIESVYSSAGVIVLMDLGSAIISAEMALEFLSEEQRKNVRLCEAPLVEGAIAAVVQASTGANIEQVMAEARAALIAKSSQLSVATKADDIIDNDNQKIVVSEKKIHLIINNKLGLHARPAAKFVSTAAQFKSDITVQNLTKNSNSVTAKSINQVITLGVRQGHEIVITAVGDDAELALGALQQLVENNFGETSAKLEEKRKQPTEFFTNKSINNLIGIPASPGIGMGSVVFYEPTLPEVIDEKVDNTQTEWQHLQLAIETAKQQIKSFRDDSGIFEAHLLFLQDPVLLNQAQQLIFKHHKSAAAAWKIVIDEMVITYQNIEYSYLQARASDLKDVGMRVLRILTNASTISLDLPQQSILIASDLTPSEVAQIQPQQVLGICTVAGTSTSHSSLIASMLGIPMIVGLGNKLMKLVAGTKIALNGDTGEIWLNPTETQLQILNQKKSTKYLISNNESPITLDGEKITLMANIMGITDAKFAVESGADGVGLLRTEFLYLERLTPPNEEEQFEMYQAIAEILDTLPLTIRTVDIGGDKPITYMNITPEKNPFLGWRGIRQSLDCPEMLKTQLRAILRASYGHNIKLMFPMVSSVREVRAAKEILEEVKNSLRKEKIAFDEKIKVGIMIEVPAAVTMADKLAKEVDFFSIGTNDLSQYIMATDRTNSKVANLVDAFEPALLRMIKKTVTAAHDAGINVSICGKLASNTMAIPILLGLGLDELSVNSSAIVSVKAAISKLKMEEIKAIASNVLQLDSASEVRNAI